MIYKKSSRPFTFPQVLENMRLAMINDYDYDDINNYDHADDDINDYDHDDDDIIDYDYDDDDANHYDYDNDDK